MCLKCLGSHDGLRGCHGCGRGRHGSLAEGTHRRSGSQHGHEQLLRRVGELTVRGLCAPPVDVVPAYLPQRGANARQDDSTRGTSRGTRDEAEEAGEGTGGDGEGAGVVWHVGHGLVDHVGVGGCDGGERGGEGCGGRGACAEEDGEGAPHDGRAVKVYVDHVVAALGDDVGDGVGSVAVVLDGAFEVAAADASGGGDADADARAAGGDPAGVAVLGDDGEGSGGAGGTTGDSGAGGGGSGGLYGAGRGMVAVVGVGVGVGVGVAVGLSWRGGLVRSFVDVVLVMVGGGGGEGLEGGVEGGLGGGGGLGLGLELGLLGLAHPDGLGRRHGSSRAGGEVGVGGR